MSYPAQTVRSARRYLRSIGVTVNADDSAEDVIASATAQGWLPPAPVEGEATPPPIATPPTGGALDAGMDPQAALQALAAMLTPPPAPAFDEKRLQGLVNQAVDERASITVTINDRVNGEVKEVAGAHAKLAKVIGALSTGHNVYCVGAAGSGKTTLAIQAADALGLTFYSTGSILAPYEVLGTLNAHGEYRRPPLREAYEHGGVFLADEFDGCSPRALLAINQLIANDRFTFPDGVTVRKHKDFKFIAAANTHGTGATRQYSGRVVIDGATLDRFIFIEVGYCEKIEAATAAAEYKANGGTTPATAANWVNTVQHYRKTAGKVGLIHIISPRASQAGAALLAQGWTKEECIEACIIKGLPADQLKQLKRAL